MRRSRALLQVKPSRIAKVPCRRTRESAGYDLCAIESVTLKKDEVAQISTGIRLAIPRGRYGQIKARSSIAKQGITALGGVIDSDYRGEVIVMLIKLTTGDYEIKAGDAVAQLIICPHESYDVTTVDELPATERGEGGFGSTGK